MRICYDFKKTGSGFTLIELLLYISISSILLLVIAAFLAMLLQARVKNQTIAEVDQQGVQVLQIITQAIRNADSIASPIPGNEASTLSLGTYKTENDPTVFSFSSGSVVASEGVGPAIELTNTRVSVTNLTFQNISTEGTSGAVRIIFTLEHINPGGRPEYNYNRQFVGTASLR